MMRTLRVKILVSAIATLLYACGSVQAQPPPDLVQEPIPTTLQTEFNATATIAFIMTTMSDDQAANLTLVAFFDHLQAGRYEEATQSYGGTYQALIGQNPSLDPQDHTALLRVACTVNGFQCLRIKIAGIDGKPSPTEFIFTVQFQQNDGSLFVLEADPTATRTSYFEIKVIKTPQGEYLVLDMPPYAP